MSKLLNKLKGSIKTLKYYKEIKAKGNPIGYKIVKCPICGGLVLDQYDICPTCSWEQDSDNKIDIDFWSPANHNSIREAKRQYSIFGRIFPYTYLMLEEDINQKFDFAKYFEDKLLEPNRYVYKLNELEINVLNDRIKQCEYEEKFEQEYMKNMR